MELIFLALIVLASFLDASGRRKKRQRQVEEMETQEAGEDTPVGTLERGGRTGRVRDRPRGARARRLPPLPDEHAGPRPDPEDVDATPPARETADSMVPADLWAVLTGQAPPERPPSAPEPTPEPAYETWGGEVVDDLHRPEHHPGDSEAVPARIEPVPSVPTATGTFTSAPPPGLAPVPTVRRSASRSRPASRYAALLRAGGADSLRQAIVLKEILEPPPGLQPPGKLK